MSDFTQQRKEKAELDYFSAFMPLWLGFNSWYRANYLGSFQNEREYINKIKTDYNTNSMYHNFIGIMIDTGNKGIGFRTNLEGLIFSLNKTNLETEEITSHIRKIDFESAPIDSSNFRVASGYKKIFFSLSEIKIIKSTGNIYSISTGDELIQLEKLYILKELSVFWGGLIEIIYQVRCLLFHGSLEPTPENNEVIKYCYFVLYYLMI